MTRKVCYITGTRADYGLMQYSLGVINVDPDLDLSALVTGMHLLPDYGETWREIEADGITIADKVPVDLSGRSGAEMSIALGQALIGFTSALQRLLPDLVLVLGDRGEMLAAAIACMHLNIHIVHIHGGERSGTIDESMRHAISKLAHYHFVATENSRDRLLRMGENTNRVFVTGAPGLDYIQQINMLEKVELYKTYGLNPALPMLVVIFHPVVQQADDAGRQAQVLLEAISSSHYQSLVFLPNADAGGASIAQIIRQFETLVPIKVAVHVPRDEYLSLVAHAQVLVGNSSSGIIEAASLGTPVVNIGDRQNFRERNTNVIDVGLDAKEINSAISQAAMLKGRGWKNVYGDGNTTSRIVELLKTISLDDAILEKTNAY